MQINHSGDSDDREDWDEIFVLNGKHDASVRINLQGKYLNILVDSGSSVNAIDRQTFEKLTIRRYSTRKIKFENLPIWW